MSEIQVPALVIPTLIKTAAKMGISIPRLQAKSGLEVDMLRLEDEIVPFSTMNQFLRAVYEEANLDSLGLYLGLELDFDYIKGFEVFITTAGTAREALKALNMFQKFSPFFSFEMREKGDETWLVYSMVKECPESLVPIYSEMFATTIHRYAKLILGKRYKLNKVIIGSRLNAPLELYKQIFDAPIEAGATLSALVIPTELLDVPLINSLPQENKQAEQELVQLIQGVIDKNGLKAQVIALFREEITNTQLSIGEVAECLGMSVRGLQRKLKEEGCRFSDLQLQIRMEYALLSLSRSDISIEKISEYLGFSNRRSFSRVFNQWYGASPSAYRKLTLHGSLAG